MSYQMKISPRRAKAARFIGVVHRAIQNAFEKSGMKQQELAVKLGVDRSTVNKRLLGRDNLTLRTIADFAWALDCDIVFRLENPDTRADGTNRRYLETTVHEERYPVYTVESVNTHSASSDYQTYTTPTTTQEKQVSVR